MKGPRIAAACVLVMLALPGWNRPVQAQPNEDSEGPCGQVVVFGHSEKVISGPILSCNDAMAVAKKMIATWPNNARFVQFDGWECAGATGGDVSMGATWDYSCENARSKAQIVFQPV